MKLFALALIAMFFALFYLQTQLKSDSRDSSNQLRFLLMSDRLPIEKLEWLDSLPENSQQAFGEKVLYLNFWAHWCKPCLDEMPLLLELQNTHSKMLEVILVNMDASPKAVQQAKDYLSKNFPELNSIYGVTDQFESLAQLPAIPFHIVIDRQKRVASQFAGNLNDHLNTFQELLQILGSEPPAPKAE